MDSRKGQILFDCRTVLTIYTDLTVRDLASYGILEDVDIAPNAENSMSVKVLRQSSPVILAFKSHDERSLLLGAIGKYIPQ